MALVQDRLLAAVMLLCAHFGAWFLADEIILAEIPGIVQFCILQIRRAEVLASN